MAATNIEICSDAIVELGGKPITDFAATQLAIDAGRLYTLEKSRLMRIHPWSFLRRQTILSVYATAPLFDWSYAFKLPTSCIRVWRVGWIDRLVDCEIHSVNGSAELQVMCNIADDLPVVYSADIAEANWPSWFADLLGVHMQARLAYRVSNSRTLAADKKTEAEAMLRMYRGIHGSEEPMRDLGGQSDALAVRY